jgi:hypothetical protein
MISNITYGTYFVFAACTTLSVPFVWFLVPETKGLKLEDVDALFTDRVLFHRRKELMRTNGADEEKVAIQQIENV